MTRYIMSAAVITAPGTYEVREISVDEARTFIDSGDFVSAVGHPGTASVLTRLLGKEIPAQRIQVSTEVGDQALVFKPSVRLEPREYSEDEIAQVPYVLWIITRIA